MCLTYPPDTLAGFLTVVPHCALECSERVTLQILQTAPKVAPNLASLAAPGSTSSVLSGGCQALLLLLLAVSANREEKPFESITMQEVPPGALAALGSPSRMLSGGCQPPPLLLEASASSWALAGMMLRRTSREPRRSVALVACCIVTPTKMCASSPCTEDTVQSFAFDVEGLPATAATVLTSMHLVALHAG